MIFFTSDIKEFDICALSSLKETIIRNYFLFYTHKLLIIRILYFIKISSTFRHKEARPFYYSSQYGLISVVIAIKFIELNKFTPIKSPDIYSAPALSVAILIGPIFDTLRVFILRISNGVSPFTADRNTSTTVCLCLVFRTCKLH